MVGGQYHAPRRFTHWNETQDPVYKSLSEPHWRCRRVRKISPPLRFDPWTVQLVASHYTDWAIPAHAISSTPIKNMAFPQSIFTKLTNSQQHYAPIFPTEFHRYHKIKWYVRIQFNLRLWVRYALHRANAYEPLNSINVCGGIQIRHRMQKIRAKFHLYPQR